MTSAISILSLEVEKLTRKHNSINILTHAIEEYLKGYRGAPFVTQPSPGVSCTSLTPSKTSIMTSPSISNRLYISETPLPKWPILSTLTQLISRESAHRKRGSTRIS